MSAKLLMNFEMQAQGRDSSALKKALFAFILDAWNESAPLFFGWEVTSFDKTMPLAEFRARRDSGNPLHDKNEAFHAIGTTYNKAVGLIELGEASPLDLYVELPRSIKLFRRPAEPYDDIDSRGAGCISVAFLDYLFWQSLKFLGRNHPGFDRVPADETMACEDFLIRRTGRSPFVLAPESAF